MRSSASSGRPPAADREATSATDWPRAASVSSASSAVSAVVQTDGLLAVDGHRHLVRVAHDDLGTVAQRAALADDVALTDDDTLVVQEAVDRAGERAQLLDVAVHVERDGLLRVGERCRPAREDERRSGGRDGQDACPTGPVVRRGGLVRGGRGAGVGGTVARTDQGSGSRTARGSSRRGARARGAERAAGAAPGGVPLVRELADTWWEASPVGPGSPIRPSRRPAWSGRRPPCGTSAGTDGPMSRTRGGVDRNRIVIRLPSAPTARWGRMCARFQAAEAVPHVSARERTHTRNG